MSYVNVDAEPATELFYVDIGEGQPVVLIHGWPLSHRMWERQIDALVDAGFRCIAYDRRGFGDSGKPAGGYDYDSFASDLNDLMLALDLYDAVLVGFSMGGGEVARYLSTYGSERVAKAVLLGSVVPGMLQSESNPNGAPQAVFDGLIAAIKHDRIALLDGFLPDFFAVDQKWPDVSADLIPYYKSLAWPALPQATAQCVTAFGTTDFTDDIAGFDVPTLIVHGDGDRSVPIGITSARAAEMIEGSRYEVFAGAPHGFPATHAAQLNALLLEFLQS